MKGGILGKYWIISFIMALNNYSDKMTHAFRENVSLVTTLTTRTYLNMTKGFNTFLTRDHKPKTLKPLDKSCVVFYKPITQGKLI